MRIFNVETFLRDLNVKFNEAELNNSLTVNDYCEKFYHIYEKVHNEYASLKKVTRKEKQLKAKPWLTRGLLKSINHKNNLFKKLHKNYNEKLLDYYKCHNLLNRTY